MTTRLEQFIKSRGIKPAHLAAVSGYSRQHLLRIRMGRMEPTRRCIAAILAAIRILSGRDQLPITEVFSFEDGPLELNNRSGKARLEALRLRLKLLDDASEAPPLLPGWGWRHWKAKQATKVWPTEQDPK